LEIFTQRPREDSCPCVGLKDSIVLFEFLHKSVLLGEADGCVKHHIVVRAEIGHKEGILEFFIDATLFERLGAQQAGVDHRDGHSLLRDQSPRPVRHERKYLELAVDAVEAGPGRGDAHGPFEPQADAALVDGKRNGMRGAQQNANARFGFGQRNAIGRSGRSHLGREEDASTQWGMRRFQFFLNVSMNYRPV